MKHRNRWIMGSAIGLASIAVAIDHTRHRLPEVTTSASDASQIGDMDSAGDDTPCGLDVSPCGIDD